MQAHQWKLYESYFSILRKSPACKRYTGNTAHCSKEKPQTDVHVLIYLALQLAGHVSVIFPTYYMFSSELVAAAKDETGLYSLATACVRLYNIKNVAWAHIGAGPLRGVFKLMRPLTHHIF